MIFLKTLSELIVETIGIKNDLETLREKSIPDFDANILITKIESLQMGLQELDKMNSGETADIDLEVLLFRASTDTIADHVLSKIGDEFSQEAYIVLLLLVAKANCELTKENIEVCMHAARVAASLNVKIDMNLMLKKAEILNEKAIYQYLKAIKDNNLADAFMVDALLSYYIYDSNNDDKLEYIANIANMLAWDKAALEEAIAVVKVILESKEEICGTFNHVDVIKLRFYLKKCVKFIVNQPNTFICDNATMLDVTNEFQNFKTLADKKSIYLHNAMGSFGFSVARTEKVEFESCQFSNTDGCLFGFGNVNSVSFKNTKFYNIVCSGIDIDGSTKYKYENHGIIGFCENVQSIDLLNCSFTDCYVKVAFQFSIAREHIFSYEKPRPQPYRGKLFYGIDRYKIKDENCTFSNSSNIV